MKLEEPVNPNYAAVITRVPALVKLANADRLQAIPLFGRQAIVGLDVKVGDLGVYFPSETQLSFEFAFENSLHDHATKETQGIVLPLNKDASAKGYLGDKRRIKAITLRTHRSDALFLPLSCLAFTGAKLSELQEGDTFDVLNGHEICKKYQLPVKAMRGMPTPPKMPVRVESRVFPEHFDTPQFFRVDRNLDPNAWCVVTQKLHGTSIRVGYVPVKRSLGFLERLAARVGVKVKEYEYDMVYGSHHVVKDANNPRQQHFYDHDLWSAEGKKLDGLIPQNYILYGELIGWVPSRRVQEWQDPNTGTHSPEIATAPIQAHYTYDLPPGQCRLYVYRVSVVNEQGTVTDLSWDAVKDFCLSIGVESVPELWRGSLWKLQDRQVPDMGAEGPTRLQEQFLNQNFHRYGFRQAVPLSEDSPCDEGVCLRIDDGMVPTILKAKSPIFLGHETKMLDAEVVDIEETGELVADGVE